MKSWYSYVYGSPGSQHYSEYHHVRSGRFVAAARLRYDGRQWYRIDAVYMREDFKVTLLGVEEDFDRAQRVLSEYRDLIGELEGGRGELI